MPKAPSRTAACWPAQLTAALRPLPASKVRSERKSSASWPSAWNSGASAAPKASVKWPAADRVGADMVSLKGALVAAADCSRNGVKPSDLPLPSMSPWLKSITRPLSAPDCGPLL